MPEWVHCGERWEWLHAGKVVGMVSQDGKWWAKWLHEWFGPFSSSHEAKQYMETKFSRYLNGTMDNGGDELGDLHGHGTDCVGV